MDDANVVGMQMVRASGRAGAAASIAEPEAQATRCECLSIGARGAYAEVFAAVAAVTAESLPVSSLGAAHDPPSPVTLSSSSIDFGPAGHGAMPPRRQLIVRNHTNGRMAVHWNIPRTALAADVAVGGALAKEGSDWAVAPA